MPPSPRRGTGRSSRGGGSRKRKTAPTGPPEAGPRLLYLLSDSTGNLGRHMLTAFLTQFPAGTFDVRAHNFLDSPQKVESALAEAEAAPGVVMHALVDPGGEFTWIGPTAVTIGMFAGIGLDRVLRG